MFFGCPGGSLNGVPERVRVHSADSRSTASGSVSVVGAAQGLRR